MVCWGHAENTLNRCHALSSSLDDWHFFFMKKYWFSLRIWHKIYNYVKLLIWKLSKSTKYCGYLNLGVFSVPQCRKYRILLSTSLSQKCSASNQLMNHNMNSALISRNIFQIKVNICFSTMWVRTCYFSLKPLMALCIV